MDSPERIVVFMLDDWRFGLALDLTEHAMAAVEVTPLPKAPSIVHGVFNLRGRIIPVLNIRRRFRLAERPISPADHFLIVQAGEHRVALVVDACVGVFEYSPATAVAAGEILPEIPYVRGVVKLLDGLVLIHDLATFLALEEAAALEAALVAADGIAC